MLSSHWMADEDDVPRMRPPWWVRQYQEEKPCSHSEKDAKDQAP